MIYVEIKKFEAYGGKVSNLVLEFKDINSYCGDSRLTIDAKFVIGRSKIYRVINVSSKPIIRKNRKVIDYKRMKEELNKLDEKRRVLFKQIDNLMIEGRL